MNKVMFAVKNNKLNTFGTPMTVPTREHVIRAITDVLENGTTELSKYPQDFEIYIIGEWIETEGIIVAQQPDFLENVTAIKRNLDLATAGEKNE